MDDGLFLNLDTSGPAKPVSQTIKGGRWKDRKKLRLESKGIKEKPGDGRDRPRQKRGRESQDFGRDIPKRPRPETKDKKEKKEKPPAKERTHNNSISREQYAVNKKRDGNTFVSSIFSAGDHDDAQDADLKDKTKGGPSSNAPLNDASSFAELGVNAQLCAQLTQHMNLHKPTKIQKAVIPRLLSGASDLFVQAQTGSGKTLAFILPVLTALMQQPDLNRESGLFALILTPTRELSNQIHSVLETLMRCCHWLVSGVVIGGEKKKSEKARIRKGINVLVATPGRLADHLENTTSLDVSKVKWLILDEGDRLMELGFEQTISQIIQVLQSRKNFPGPRINVLCSATMKGQVEALGEMSLSGAEWVGTDGDDKVQQDQHLAPTQLVQEYCVVPAKLRLVTLASILKNMVSGSEPTSTMVFLSCSDSVDFHFNVLTRDSSDTDYKSSMYKNSTWLGANVAVLKLHGSLDQHTRTRTLNAFASAHKDKHTILLCTDVASRGLDLPLITNVVEFDPPAAVEDHLHRVGRTARAGKAGSAIIVLLPGPEEGYVDMLAPLHPNGLTVRSHTAIIKLAFGKTGWESEATTWHLEVERHLLENADQLNDARKAFSSHIRAYTTHSSLERAVFNYRTLHLGHIAKSFGLRETPGGMKRTESGPKKKVKIDKPLGGTVDKDRFLQLARKSSMLTSEFNLA